MGMPYFLYCLIFELLAKDILCWSLSSVKPPSSWSKFRRNLDHDFTGSIFVASIISFFCNFPEFWVFTRIEIIIIPNTLDGMKKAEIERKLFNLIKERKVGRLSHVLREKKYSILQKIIKGEVNDKREVDFLAA